MALGATTNAGGVDVSELTQEQVTTVLLKPLETASKFEAAGPVVIPTASPVRAPRMGAALDLSTSWYGENELIGESNPDFGEIALLPSTMKSIKRLVRFSNELVRQSAEAGITMDSVLQNKLVNAVATAMDSRLFGATGDGVTQPAGMFAPAFGPVQTVDTNGTLTLDMLLDGEAKLLDLDGIDESRVRWIMPSSQFVALRKLKSSDGKYLIESDVTAGAGYTLFGRKVIVTKHAAATALVDMSKVLYARDVAPAIKILDQTFGDYDQQALRVVYRVDAKLGMDNAMVVFKDTP